MIIYSAILLTLIIVHLKDGEGLLGLCVLMPLFGRIFGWW